MKAKKERKMKARRTKTTVEKKMGKKRRKVKKVLGRIKLTRRELLQARIEMSSFGEMNAPLFCQF